MPDLTDTICQCVDAMPSLSPTVAKVMAVANDPTYHPRDLMAVIRMDPVLTARILKLINSAYFSMNKKIVDLNRALVMLGVNTIKNLAISTAVVGSFPSGVGSKAIRRIWRHSLACGVAAKSLAGAMGEDRNVLEEYFIAGLLHDIGKIILIYAIPEDYEQLTGGGDIHGPDGMEEEMNRLGLHHCSIGALIARRWKLSPPLFETIGMHHTPEAGSPTRRVVPVVHLADAACLKMGYGTDKESVELPVEAVALASTGLDLEQIEGTLAHLPADVKKAEVFLEGL